MSLEILQGDFDTTESASRILVVTLVERQVLMLTLILLEAVHPIGVLCQRRGLETEGKG